MTLARAALQQTGAYFIGDGTCKLCRRPIEWWVTSKGSGKQPRDAGTLTVHFATCPARPPREKKERVREPELFEITNVIEFRPQKES